MSQLCLFGIRLTLAALFLDYDGQGNGHIDTSVARNSSRRFVLASLKYQSQGPVVRTSLKQSIPEGPYFFSPRTGAIFQAYRLFSDHQLAFTEAALGDGRGGFMPLPAATGVSLLLWRLEIDILLTIKPGSIDKEHRGAISPLFYAQS